MSKKAYLLLLLYLPICLTACGRKDEEIALKPYYDNTETIQIVNDSQGKINRDLYTNATLESVEKYFKNKGYPPFIDAQNIGRKSINTNGNVIYLYSSDMKYINKISFRHFVNGAFDKNTIASGINQISELIALVLNRELTIDERKQIRTSYGMIMDIGEIEIKHTIQFDGISFILEIEPLSKTILCSYNLNIN